MAVVKFHAGNFMKRNGVYANGKLTLHAEDGYGIFGDKHSVKDDIETLEIASEESVKRLGGTVGWGVAGAALLGPVGLLAGLLVGGRGNDVTFVATFKDGRRLLATTTSKAFTDMTAKRF